MMKIAWKQKLDNFLRKEPKDREQLVTLLHNSFERNIMDAEALSMIEGVLQVSDMKAGDIMVPRTQMGIMNINDPMEKIIEYAIETAHSRFPVIGDDKDDVIGILLAKDLLRYYQNNDNFDLRENLRPAGFIPESKRLNVLLEDFRKNRNHIAIVVDEYGGVAGLVTIEDVLEQIVGDIEDEFDFDETEANIVLDGNGNYRVKAYTDLTDINEELGTNFSTEDFDTIGGLVLAHVGRLPKGGEEFQIGGLDVKIIRADSRKLQILMIAKPHMNVEKTQ
ncbi:MAG: magnesium/cobalt efflux protein [Proteobacteria bacterium]|nr:magnesium/cobalt efflux protein [Pseudomonadota bacterium]